MDRQADQVQSIMHCLIQSTDQLLNQLSVNQLLYSGNTINMTEHKGKTDRQSKCKMEIQWRLRNGIMVAPC